MTRLPSIDMRRAGCAVLVVASLAAVSSSGCSADDNGDVLGSDGAWVVVAPPADGGTDALVSGVVRLIDGCLGIEDSVALWPAGTELVSEDPLTIDVPGTGEVQVGAAVRGAGGYIEAGGYGGEPTLPKSCSEAPVVSFRSD